MAVSSIRQRKNQTVENYNRLIDLNSAEAGEFKPFDGQPFEVALFNVAAAFSDAAATNLQNADRVASGNLVESIKPSEIRITGSLMEIDISVLDYYKFIDKGVKGWQSGNPSDSPYAFKQPQKGGSGKKSSEMVTAIRKWLVKEGMRSRQLSRKSPTHAISSREKRRQKITDTATSTAIKVAGIIRRQGLKKTNFWTDAGETASKVAEQEFGTALQISIINSL